MQTSLPLACFLSIIRPPSIQFENSLLQIAPVDKVKCPYVRDVNDVIFQLYTRHNPALPQGLLIDDDERLYASNMDFHVDTVIIFHAFMETPNDGSVLWLREAYTPRGDTNVIVVDAQRLEAGPWYIRAAENTWYIGRIAAQFIDYLVSRGLKLSKTQLVGHSLGAQSAGVAGGALHSGKVSRITGLDAALPLFNKLPLNQRLDPSDADFVDAIHTDAGIFGFKDPIGHVDFFPNGGISPQPGCELEAVIPQQLLLNDCTNIKGYYVFHLCEKYNSENGQSKAANIARILNNIIRIIKKINDVKRVNIKPSESDTEDYEKLLTIEKRKETKEGFVTKFLTKNTKNGGNKLKKKSSADRRHRERRFASLFNSEGNKLFKILEFLVKYKQNIIPVVTVMREISTLVKTSNLELNQMVKEQNQYIGPTATLTPLTYSLEVNSDSKIREFFKKIFGFANGKVTVVT